MEEIEFSKKQEGKENFVKNEAFTSLLSNGEISKTRLPYEIKSNPEMIKECRERKELIKKLNDIYIKIPTLINIEDALEKDLIKIEEIEKFYISIINIIQNDKKSNRLLLYFPIELIPNKKNEKIKFFSEFYKNNWKDLLKEIDLREDFNEGDIIEKEIRSGPLPKVSKAAHLIPLLAERDLINKEDIFNILENEDDPIIIESTLDTIRILAEKKYLNNLDIERLEKSNNVNVRNIVKMIRYDKKEKEEINIKNSNIDGNLEKLNIRELFNSMNLELSDIEHSILEKDKVVKDRMKWLISVQKDKIIEKYSEIVYNKIKEKDSEIQNILGDKNLNEENLLSFIKALEKLLINDTNNQKAWNSLFNLKQSTNSDIKNKVFNTFSRLDSINISNEKYFSKIETEKQDKEIEKNIEHKIKNILSKIESDNLLSKYIYPVAMLYGSHMKGYGKENSDTDIGVFVKENTDFDKHIEIKNKFNSALEELNINGSIMEFWLKKENNSLWIQDFENPDNSLGDSLLTSPLIGAWYGNEKNISTLQKEIIPKYLYSENKHILGFEARELWLRDMEHSLIQYRLMHKGYKEKNLKQGGIDSEYKDEIDGDGMFYDSGFRRLATKIYLEKVFLPKLKK